MKNTQNKYFLSEEERQQYRGLLSQAFNAASLFNGSEETYEHLMDSLISVEEFVTERNDHKTDEALEIDFAHQSGFANQQFYTVSNLLQHASSQVFGMLARLGDLKELLNALSVGGAHIDYSDMVYVLTDEALIVGEGDSDRTVQEFIKQPRLAILVKELQTIGIYTDDLVVRVGKIFEDKIRKLPYVVVEIPRLGKQVAVCDQYGETTFVSQSILEPHVWASYTKKQLKALEGIKAVSYTESWPFRICNLLAYGSENMTPAQPVVFPKVDVKEYVRNRKKTRMYLNEEIILNHALVYLKEHQRWPTGSSSGAVQGMPGETWASWNGALMSSRRGLSEKTSLWQLFKRFIVREAKLYEEVNGHLPLRHAGPLVGRPDITWELIDTATTNFNKGGLYEVYTTGGLIKKGRHSKQGPQKLDILTPDIIMDHATLFLKENWMWPHEDMQEPVPGLNEEHWQIWDYCLGLGERGLPGGSYLFKTIWDWVAEQAQKFEKRHGHLPDAGSGLVEGYPGLSWDMVDLGLRKQKWLKLPLESVLSLHLKEERNVLGRDGQRGTQSYGFPSPKNS